MTITQILDAVRRLVCRMAERGANTAEIDAAVGELLKRQGMEREMAQAIQIEAKRAWIAKHTLSDAERAIAADMVTRAGADFAKVDGKIRLGVVRVVAEARKAKKPLSELRSDLLGELDKNKNWADSVARTTKSGFSRANTVQQAMKAGVTEFRYEGAGAQRQFCQTHLGNVYTLSEIKNMSNGQGLSVLYYMGGYRCVHRWVPVF